MNKTKRKIKITPRAIVSAVAIILVIAGLSLGILLRFQYEYHRGYDAGVEAERNSTTEQLSQLANDINAKENLAKQLSALPIPTELDAEGIDNYISALNAIVESTVSTEAKELLGTYLENWQKFKETYDTEDNSAIEEQFNQLKSLAEETSTKLQQALDQNITSSLEKLQ
ncbi:hypothetical protein IKF76_00420 [Candidatus Saccharibacteria bacterium]|nr:hypothetical protein [Candidatus Saccharibacteria bacterium]